MRRHLLIPLLLLLASTTLAACGNDHSDHPAVMPDEHRDAMDDHAMDDHAMDDDRGNDHHGGGHGSNSPVAPGARAMAVTGDDFAFDPAEITVDAGEAIAIELTSIDIQHDFTIDDLDAHVVADRGETATGGFTAGEPGRYTYYCAVPGHRQAGMEGTLVVGAPPS